MSQKRACIGVEKKVYNPRVKNQKHSPIVLQPNPLYQQAYASFLDSNTEHYNEAS
jgi:hypothetical protein